ncbi:hypothetical protein [Bradyrhizobium sp. ARR65]|uniref:hypothetical protein n=1 Tax=Bradyrhizobium sp. ARR65 TaxID=1040989 RepID=UPI000AF87D88|nr:hypothetical protein [Bradyrhizobium sp. ARR65]
MHRRSSTVRGHEFAAFQDRVAIIELLEEHGVSKQEEGPALRAQGWAVAAANYITKLPKREHDAPEWRAAIETLMLAAEHGGPTMMAHRGDVGAVSS